MENKNKGLSDDVCINCTKTFKRKKGGYERYSVRSSLKWNARQYSDSVCSHAMLVSDALMNILPGCNLQTNSSTRNNELMEFICPRCFLVLKDAMMGISIGKAAEKEFIKLSAENGYIGKNRINRPVKRERETVDDAPRVNVARQPRPVLISSVPIRNTFKRQRVDYVDASTSTSQSVIVKTRSWRIAASDLCRDSRYKQMFRTLCKKSPKARKDMEGSIHSFVKKETSNFNKQNPCKMLINPVTEETIQKFDWDEVVKVVSKTMPYLFSAICAVCTNKKVNYVVESKSAESHRMRTAIGNVIATLLYLRRKKFKFVPGLNSLLLWRSGCVNHKVLSVLSQLGLCVNRTTASRLVKTLTSSTMLPTNHMEGNLDEDSTEIPPEDDESSGEDEQTYDDDNFVEINRKFEDEQTYDDDNFLEVNEKNEDDQTHDDHNYMKANGENEDEQSDVSMSDNEDQSDDEISHDSSEGNSEQEDEIS